jgi:hypothetical protein
MKTKYANVLNHNAKKIIVNVFKEGMLAVVNANFKIAKILQEL